MIQYPGLFVRTVQSTLGPNGHLAVDAVLNTAQTATIFMFKLCPESLLTSRQDDVIIGCKNNGCISTILFSICLCNKHSLSLQTVTCSVDKSTQLWRFLRPTPLI